MILGLYCGKHDPTPKPLPPGIQIPLTREGETHSATVKHLPLILVDDPTPPANPPYLLRFDDGTAIERKYEELAEAMHPSTTASSTSPHDNIGLPSIFKDGYEATIDINRVFQKGYIKRQADNTYRFSVRGGPLSPTELWGFPLHEFEQQCDKLMMYKTLFLGHNVVPLFLRPFRSPHQPCTLFVSDCSLVRDCPVSLTAATYADHPDRDTWLLRYHEEKQGLFNHLVYTVIDQEEY